MLLYVLNANREIIDTVEVFKSLIWTTRFQASGDFELVLPASTHNFELFKNGKYLVRVDRPTQGMFIKNIQLDTDIENGDYLTVTGKSISSLLEQRIIWEQTIVEGIPEDCIIELVLQNIAYFASADRYIDVLNIGEYVESENTMEAQFTGDNLAEAVQSICKAYGLGYTIDVDLQYGTFFTFRILNGLDRSSNQNTNPRVIFSNEFDNLLKTKYILNTDNYKNVARVAGEGEGSARKMITVGEGSGFDRYEIFVDAKDISTNNGEIDDETYEKQLIERGLEKLAEQKVIETIEGEAELSMNYKFGEDYDIGDIVEVVNEYGMTITARITEVIECEDDTGTYIIPSFTTD